MNGLARSGETRAGMTGFMSAAAITLTKQMPTCFYKSLAQMVSPPLLVCPDVSAESKGYWAL